MKLEFKEVFAKLFNRSQHLLKKELSTKIESIRIGELKIANRGEDSLQSRFALTFLRSQKIDKEEATRELNGYLHKKLVSGMGKIVRKNR